MSTIKFANNATAAISANIGTAATSITVGTGQGGVFPTLNGAGEYFFATIYDASQYEIVKVTNRSGDTLTVERAQEGTTAKSFLSGDSIEIRVTAQGLFDFSKDQSHDNGSSATFDFRNGTHQKWNPGAGSKTFSVTNWNASGYLSQLLIEGTNLAAATITWGSVKWVLPNGGTSTTFSDTAVTLSSTTDFILIWTGDGGTNVYGKVMR